MYESVRDVVEEKEVEERVLLEKEGSFFILTKIKDADLIRFGRVWLVVFTLWF